MYEERKEGFSLKELLVQILLVIIFVFILLWLFPTKSYVKDSIDNAYNAKLQPLYSQIYGQNLTTMKETAIAYFTTDRLPSKVGDSVTITLAEMQNKKLILDLIDSNNNKCDAEKSYVKIVKDNKEYIMTVSLNCTDTSDYIDVHIGCYNYCESGACEKKTVVTKKIVPITKSYEYEYEKITNGKWGNWSDWSEWSTAEATSTDYRNVETKTEKVKVGTKTVETGTITKIVDAEKRNGEFYCTVGKLVNGNQCYINASLINAHFDGYDYSCKEGTRSGTKCIIQKTTTTSEVAEVITKTTYACPEGYTTTDTKITANTVCTKIDVSKKTAIFDDYTSWIYNGKYTYTSKQYNSETRKVVRVSSSINEDCVTNCTENTFTYLVYTRLPIYACPEGYTTTDSKITANTVCTKSTSSTAKSVAKTSTSKTCPASTIKIGAKCYYSGMEVETEDATRTPKYSCETGKLINGNKCLISGKTVNASRETEYYCKEGTKSGNKCVITTQQYSTIDVYSTVTYYRFQTRTFISGERDVKWSTSQKDTTLLSQGYTLTGNKREIKSK